MGYTPGPWKVEYARARTKCLAANITAGSGDSVCALFDAAKVGNEMQEVTRANASLIAAAPDLLAACIEAEKMYRAIQPTGGWQHVHDSLRAAIALAAPADEEGRG